MSEHDRVSKDRRLSSRRSSNGSTWTVQLERFRGVELPRWAIFRCHWKPVKKQTAAVSNWESTKADWEDLLHHLSAPLHDWSARAAICGGGQWLRVAYPQDPRMPFQLGSGGASWLLAPEAPESCDICGKCVPGGSTVSDATAGKAPWESRSSTILQDESVRRLHQWDAWSDKMRGRSLWARLRGCGGAAILSWQQWLRGDAPFVRLAAVMSSRQSVCLSTQKTKADLLEVVNALLPPVRRRLRGKEPPPPPSSKKASALWRIPTWPAWGRSRQRGHDIRLVKLFLRLAWRWFKAFSPQGFKRSRTCSLWAKATMIGFFK